MRPISLLAAALLLVHISTGQQTTHYVDSLKTELGKHLPHDSLRVKLLIEVANSIYHNAPDDALKYSEEAIAISKEISWQLGIARAYRQKGVVYYIQSDYMKALEYYQAALKEYEEGTDKHFEASLHNNMANIYMEMGNYKESLLSYNQFLLLARQNKWKREEAIALMNTGLVLMKENKFDSAILFYNESIDTASSINDLQVLAYALSNKGAALEKSGRYDEAINTLLKSIPYADSVNDGRIKSQTLGALAEAFIFKKDFNEAEKYALRSLEISRSLNIVQFQKEMYELLSDVYKNKNEPEKALNYYKTFIQFRDSTMNEDKKSEMVRLEMQYKAENKEAVLNAEYAQKIKQQRLIKNTVIGGFIFLAIGGLLSFTLYKRKRDAVTLQKEAELKAEISDTEMKALRAQMNPHFIFNSLNSIGDYITKNNTKVADEYLTKFAKLMRMILENSEQKEVPLHDDLKALELYMQLEAIRMNNKFTYEIKVDEDINRESTMIPPLILQPFVENSIWHGIAKKEGPGKITVQIKREGNMINCIVEDDGIGRKEFPAQVIGNKAEGQKSFGMKITKERIDILNKIKNTTAGVEITDQVQGTKVELKLPLELSF
ncbi:MAG: tetratricopeptide repeat protein [Bacteroidota bacterium]